MYALTLFAVYSFFTPLSNIGTRLNIIYLLFPFMYDFMTRGDCTNLHKILFKLISYFRNDFKLLIKHTSVEQGKNEERQKIGFLV